MEILFLNSTTPINIPNLINKLMELNSSFPKITQQSIGGKRIKSKRYLMKSIRKKSNKKRNNKTRKIYN